MNDVDYEVDDFDYSQVDNYSEFDCINMDDGKLVFEPRDTLTEDEKELADLHLGCCLACQIDMEFDHLMNRMDENNSRC